MVGVTGQAGGEQQEPTLHQLHEEPRELSQQLLFSLLSGFTVVAAVTLIAAVAVVTGIAEIAWTLEQWQSSQESQKSPAPPIGLSALASACEPVAGDAVQVLPLPFSCGLDRGGCDAVALPSRPAAHGSWPPQGSPLCHGSASRFAAERW